MIPKTVYQTWITKKIPKNIELIRDFMIKNNPNYRFVLYDDNDIYNFIITYSEDNTYNQYLLKIYNSLAIGASKADFWRYLILYKHGGIYLDIDSIIIKSLDELLELMGEDTKGIITRENNPGIFNNWILLFEPNHLIMKLMIEQCCYNIEHKITNDVVSLTGPILFTNILNKIYKDSSFVLSILSSSSSSSLPNENQFGLKRNINYLSNPTKIELYNDNNNDDKMIELKKEDNLYFLSDDEMNNIFFNLGLFIKIYKKDMGEFAKNKHRFSNDLYNVYNSNSNILHWRIQVALNGNSPFSSND